MKASERVEKMISEAIKREGKKSNMKVGDGREFIRILVDMEVEVARRGGHEDEYPSSIIFDAAEEKLKK